MSVLKKLWDRWMVIARVIGDWIARFLLTIFYFSIMLPFSLGMTLFGDPLKIKTKPQDHWMGRTTPPPSLEDARRQS